VHAVPVRAGFRSKPCRRTSFPVNLRLRANPDLKTTKERTVDPTMAGQRRHACRAVVAAAGYGKTTALRAAYSAGDVRWYRGAPLTLTGATTAAVDDGARTIVIDDAPELTLDDVRTLADLLAELTDPLTIVVASRSLATADLRAAGMDRDRAR
jgi:hypothetical protein